MLGDWECWKGRFQGWYGAIRWAWRERRNRKNEMRFQTAEEATAWVQAHPDWPEQKAEYIEMVRSGDLFKGLDLTTKEIIELQRQALEGVGE